MHGFEEAAPALPDDPSDKRPWYKLLNRYHWFVLIVAALGWVFDCLDQQLFILARPQAMTELLDPQAFKRRDFHVHVPAGAIPKDGPSAGVTMVTAIASLLTHRSVKPTVGMTGEVTLQGRVLPIGGVKQKVLAAHAAGLTDVLLPERNRGDLDDVPQEVRDAMTFHFAMTVDEVLGVALEPAPLRQAA